MLFCCVCVCSQSVKDVEENFQEKNDKRGFSE